MASLILALLMLLETLGQPKPKAMEDPAPPPCQIQQGTGTGMCS
jgi:hypothetical protein